MAQMDIWQRGDWHIETSSCGWIHFGRGTERVILCRAGQGRTDPSWIFVGLIQHPIHLNHLSLIYAILHSALWSTNEASQFQDDLLPLRREKKGIKSFFNVYI